jgi:hypothetical protein
LHHFVAAGVWDAAPLETELLNVRARFAGNPHPAARSENDWKVAAFEY